jgi:hypothetical protein
MRSDEVRLDFGRLFEDIDLESVNSAPIRQSDGELAYQVDTAISDSKLICLGVHAVEQVVDERAHLGNLVSVNIGFETVGIQAWSQAIFDFGERVFLVELIFTQL